MGTDRHILCLMGLFVVQILVSLFGATQYAKPKVAIITCYQSGAELRNKRSLTGNVQEHIASSINLSRQTPRAAVIIVPRTAFSIAM